MYTYSDDRGICYHSFGGNVVLESEGTRHEGTVMQCLPERW